MTSESSPLTATESSGIVYIFLVYVGRSGSTFLARQIAENTDEILVFAETKLIDMLLSLTENSFIALSAQERLALVKQDPRWPNLGLTEERLLKLCNECTSRRNLFDKICEQKLVNRKKPKYILIKNGASVFSFQKLNSFFDNRTIFLHARRDPRGSTCSRMRKAPVYKEKAGARMEDPWFLARFWNHYNSQVAKIVATGQNVIEIEYEELIERSQDTISELFGKLNVSIQSGLNESLALSETEKAKKHKNVLGPALSNRTDAWKHEMRRDDGITVEAICSDHIKELYFTQNISMYTKNVILLTAYIKHLFYTLVRTKEKLIRT